MGVLHRGESNRRLWLAIEYVDGPYAGRLLRERYSAGTPPSAVSMIVDGIARALDFAHRRGLLHRHVKPTNILLDDPYSDAYRILLTTSRRRSYTPTPQLMSAAGTSRHRHPWKRPIPTSQGWSGFAPTLATDPAARFDTLAATSPPLSPNRALSPSRPRRRRLLRRPQAVGEAEPSAPERPRIRRSVLAPALLALAVVALLAAAGVISASPARPHLPQSPRHRRGAVTRWPPASALPIRDKLAQLLMVGGNGRRRRPCGGGRSARGASSSQLDRPVNAQ